MTTHLDQNYWQSRYLQNQTGWDLGEVSPPLKAYFDGLNQLDMMVLFYYHSKLFANKMR